MCACVIYPALSSYVPTRPKTNCYNGDIKPMHNLDKVLNN